MSIFLKLGHVPWQTHRTNPFFPTPNSFSSINRYINIYRYDTRRSARDQRRFDTEVRHGGSTWVISEWRARRGEEEAGFGRGGGGGTPFTFPSRGRRGPSGGCGVRPGRIGTHRGGFSPGRGPPPGRGVPSGPGSPSRGRRGRPPRRRG